MAVRHWEQREQDFEIVEGAAARDQRLACLMRLELEKNFVAVEAEPRRRRQTAEERPACGNEVAVSLAAILETQEGAVISDIGQLGAETIAKPVIGAKLECLCTVAGVEFNRIVPNSAERL